MEAVNLATPVFGPMTDFHSFPTSPEHTLALLKNLSIGAPNPDTRALCRVALDALEVAKADGDVDGIILAYEKVIRSQQNALLATDEATKMHEMATEAFQNTMAKMTLRHAEKL